MRRPTNRKPGRHSSVKELRYAIMFCARIVTGMLGGYQQPDYAGDAEREHNGHAQKHKDKE